MVKVNKEENKKKNKDKNKLLSFNDLRKTNKNEIKQDIMKINKDLKESNIFWFKKLFKGIEKYLWLISKNSKEGFIIIRDDILIKLPWCALYSINKHKYIIECFKPFVCSKTIQQFKKCIEFYKYRIKKNINNTNVNNVLLIGDPIIRNPIIEELRPLHNRSELDQIQNICLNKKEYRSVISLHGKKCNKKLIKENILNSNIFYVATHCKDSKSLILSNGEKLSSLEIIEWFKDIVPNLYFCFLNCCDSGGELANAFLISGVYTVIATIFPSDNIISAYFGIQYFHQTVKLNMPKFFSMRKMIYTLWEIVSSDKQLPIRDFPCLWGGFVLLGYDEELSKSSNMIKKKHFKHIFLKKQRKMIKKNIMKEKKRIIFISCPLNPNKSKSNRKQKKVIIFQIQCTEEIKEEKQVIYIQKILKEMNPEKFKSIKPKEIHLKQTSPFHFKVIIKRKINYINVNIKIIFNDYEKKREQQPVLEKCLVLKCQYEDTIKTIKKLLHFKIKMIKDLIIKRDEFDFFLIDSEIPIENDRFVYEFPQKSFIFRSKKRGWNKQCTILKNQKSIPIVFPNILNTIMINFSIGTTIRQIKLYLLKVYSSKLNINSIYQMKLFIERQIANDNLKVESIHKNNRIYISIRGHEFLTRNKNLQIQKETSLRYFCKEKIRKNKLNKEKILSLITIIIFNRDSNGIKIKSLETKNIFNKELTVNEVIEIIWKKELKELNILKNNVFAQIGGKYIQNERDLKLKLKSFGNISQIIFGIKPTVTVNL